MLFGRMLCWRSFMRTISRCSSGHSAPGKGVRGLLGGNRAEERAALADSLLASLDSTVEEGAEKAWQGPKRREISHMRSK
jgi:hypothetical protein